MKGEETDDYYRYIFRDGKMIHQGAEVIIKYLEDDEEVYEFGKMSAKDESFAQWRENMNKQEITLKDG
jgi:hypothetical protein